MKRSLFVLTLILCVLGLFLGSQVTPAWAAKPTGTLRIATPDFSYESMDPIVYESFWGWAMYDSLLTFDPKGNYRRVGGGEL